MTIKRAVLTSRIAFMAIFLMFALPSYPQGPENLSSMVSLLQARLGGTLGVALLHVESGRQLAFNGDFRFPMQSVYKLPIVIQLLSRVDKGEVYLSDVVSLAFPDQRPGFSPLAQRISAGGTRVMVGELLRMVVIDSDNTASDALLRVAGGPAAVTAKMRALGLKDISIDRPEGDIFLDHCGVPPQRRTTIHSLAGYVSACESVSPTEKRAAALKYSLDRRDTTSPLAMVRLLLHVYRRDELSSQNAELLLNLMAQCSRASGRIKGLLPPDTVVAHRPGTGGDTSGVNACTNDVGIVSLPNSLGHILIAAFVKDSRADLADREDAIARIARAAYDRPSAF